MHFSANVHGPTASSGLGSLVVNYPGITVNDFKASLSGSVEVVAPSHASKKGVKASLLTISLQKLETIPRQGAAIASADREKFREIIKTVTLWPTSGQAWTGNEASAPLPKREFHFSIPVLDACRQQLVPPSLHLDNNTSISYEVIVTLKKHSKGGLFSSKKPEEITASSPVVLDKFELLSTWPIYRFIALTEDRQIELKRISMRLRRSNITFGPGEEVILPIHISSKRADVVKVTRLEFSLKEVVTLKKEMKGADNAVQQSISLVFNIRSNTDILLYHSEEHRFELRGLIPANYDRFTCNARHVGIAYFAKIAVCFEKTMNSATEQVENLELDGIPITICTHNSRQATTTMQEILKMTNGQIPAYLDVPHGHIMPPSPPGSSYAPSETSNQPRPPVNSRFSQTSASSTGLPIIQRIPSPGRLLVNDAKARLAAGKQATSQTYITNPDQTHTPPSSSHDEKKALQASYSLQDNSSNPPLTTVTSRQSQTSIPTPSVSTSSHATAEAEKLRLYNEAQALVDARNRVAGPLPTAYATAAEEKQRAFTSVAQNPTTAWSASGSVAKETAAISAYEEAMAAVKEREQNFFKNNTAPVITSYTSGSAVLQPESALQEKARLAQQYANAEKSTLATSNSLSTQINGFSDEKRKYMEAVAARDRRSLSPPPELTASQATSSSRRSSLDRNLSSIAQEKSRLAEKYARELGAVPVAEMQPSALQSVADEKAQLKQKYMEEEEKSQAKRGPSSRHYVSNLPGTMHQSTSPRSDSDHSSIDSTSLHRDPAIRAGKQKQTDSPTLPAGARGRPQSLAMPSYDEFTSDNLPMPHYSGKVGTFDESFGFVDRRRQSSLLT